MSKKLEIKQRRREEAERREAERKSAARRRNLITLAIALAVVGAVAASIVFSGGGGTEDVGGSIAEAGCDDIETFDEAQSEDARGHVEDGQDVQYETSPATFGQHYGTTAAASFYDEPVAEETYVHNLEHGQIVIHYSPDLSEDSIEKLDDLVDQESDATLGVPTDGLDKPIVFTAWGAMQACEDVSQEAADEFRTRFQGRGPEQVGIPTFNG